MNDRVKAFLERIEDHTGVVRRYGKSLEAENKPSWSLKRR